MSAQPKVREMKWCGYCQCERPADGFVKFKRGRTTVTRCGPCNEARKNPEANKDRLAEIRDLSKAKTREAYTNSRGK